jgi:hypothetical protein
MDDIHLERLGGLGGFGGTRSVIYSKGATSSERLSDSDRERLESLFSGDRNELPGPADGFRYRITWETGGGTRTIEVPEAAVPKALKDIVKDQLR